MGSVTNFPGALLTRQEKTVAGTYYGSSDMAQDFPRFARMHLEGKLDLSLLISRSYPLENINDAFVEMLSGKIGRSVILFE
jgi:Zn-dependent alcohol dehydrogenase